MGGGEETGAPRGGDRGAGGLGGRPRRRGGWGGRPRRRAAGRPRRRSWPPRNTAPHPLLSPASSPAPLPERRGPALPAAGPVVVQSPLDVLSDQLRLPIMPSGPHPTYCLPQPRSKGSIPWLGARPSPPSQHSRTRCPMHIHAPNSRPHPTSARALGFFPNPGHRVLVFPRPLDHTRL